MAKWQVIYCRTVPLLTALLCILVTLIAIQNRQFQIADLAVKVGAGFVLPVSLTSMGYNVKYYSAVKRSWIEEQSTIVRISKNKFETDTGRVYSNDPFGWNIGKIYTEGTLVKFMVNPENDRQYCLSHKNNVRRK